MKLLELIVRNVRGVVQLDLRPDGKSFVVVGPNGTGKSAIVDAIDFLLTGEMGRFVGRSGFNVKEHGKHINADPKHCAVEARVRVPGFDGDIKLCRNFSKTKQLEISPPAAKAVLNPLLDVAQRRHYLLTRANILDFVLAEPRNRAEQVQTLLQIGRVERIRQALTTAVNTTQADLLTKRTGVQSSRGAASATLSLETWDESKALAAVNSLRNALGGSVINTLNDLKAGLQPPALAAIDPASPNKQPATALDAIITVGKSVSEDNVKEINRVDTELRRDLEILATDPAKLNAAHQLELIDMGIRLAGVGDTCPLCDRDWEPGTLVTYLKGKSDGGKSVKPVWQRANMNARSLMQWLADTEVRIAEIISVGKLGDPAADPSPLKAYSTTLASFRESLSDFLNRYLAFRIAGSSLSLQLGIEPALGLLRTLFTERNPTAKVDPKQKAWDSLTKLEENLRRLSIDTKTFEIARRSAERLQTLHAAFISARDTILDSLYASVAERFSHFYRQLHSDEDKFSAKLAPTDTGLKLSVDFRGVATAMPHTLHSEGHQDSMGFCLWLALSEKLQGDKFEFCLLDDIVMAIDAGHRRQIARLLKSLQPNAQILITTHDQTWAQQLKTEGVISSATLTRFIGWTLDSGPVQGLLIDFICESRAALVKNNVRDAAAALRHGLENYFHFVADALAAKVPYSLAGAYELGDLQSACASRIKDLIKSARAAAQSWGQIEVEAKCVKLDGERLAASQDVTVEQWAINRNVHYNSWMNMNANEFEPVVNAFDRYCKIFRCGHCDAALHVRYDDAVEAALTCDAGCSPLNLKKK